jgi:hypothetical protein
MVPVALLPQVNDPAFSHGWTEKKSLHQRTKFKK